MARAVAFSTLLALAGMLSAPAAFGATWENGTTPHLGQIFAVDATGEASWPYGAEDVLGDGAPMFTAAEQTLDLRTAYAATNLTQLWTRAYVSSTAAADTTLTVFFFVDADRNTGTGGGTNSTTLSPAFTTEKSPGGYDWAFAVNANGTFANVWQWQTTGTPGWVVFTTQPSQVAAEVGVDVDPIRIGTATRGYVQGRIDLSTIGLTQTCDANLYVRSARTSGASDLDMSLTTSCVAAKTNGVPTIVIVGNCATDAECPQNGVCDNGACVIAQPCAAATDCPGGDTCTADGRCVPPGACTQGGTDCAAGTRCAPNGTCVAGGGTTGKGEVEGGALHCGIGEGPGSTAALALFGLFLGVFLTRRRLKNA